MYINMFTYVVFDFSAVCVYQPYWKYVPQHIKFVIVMCYTDLGYDMNMHVCASIHIYIFIYNL